MSTIEKISKRVRQLCCEKNISLATLARKSNLSASTVYNMANAKTKNARLGNVKKICDGFGITLGEFFSTPEFDSLEQEIR